METLSRICLQPCCLPTDGAVAGRGSGVPRTTVLRAKAAALKASGSLSGKCKAIRELIPWTEVASHLNASRKSRLQHAGPRRTRVDGEKQTA
jgi:hypothetical protein